MPDALNITDVAFTSARPRDRVRGCLGWVEFTVADLLRVDAVAVRRTADGRLTLAFPARTDRAGRRHAVVAAVDAAARRAIEDAVFDALADLLPKEHHR